MSSTAKVKALEKVKVALAGNPNVGKSVIFNNLTGGKAFVGNWPGKTVEKKVGKLELNGYEVDLVDLPGIYSLTAYSVDELIARDFIVEEKPRAIIDIVNAANLERNLYLTLSLLEMGANVVVALNMVDLAESEEGIEVDAKKLSELLGVPVVPTIAIRKYGMKELEEKLLEAIKTKAVPKKIVDYGKDVEEEIDKLSSVIRRDESLSSKYDPRWLAIKLLEADEDVKAKVRASPLADELLKSADEARQKLEGKLGVRLEDYIVDMRYKKAISIADQCIRRIVVKPVTLSDLVDMSVTHKVFGIPIMLTMVFVMFRFAFDVSVPLVDLLDWFFCGVLYDAAASLSPSWLASLLADGVVTGVGTVLTFIPPIAFLFLALSAFEDFGYMARAAFVVDKIMHKIKLTGKSIVPLLLGFGCNVPAIIATRPIEDEKDRIATGLVNPLMSCAARLPVYLIIAGTFFAAYVGSAVLSMYVMGIILAILMANIIRRFIIRGPSTGFVMELPPYMMPVGRNVAMKTWMRTRWFAIKAGTLILALTIIVWLLCVTGPAGYIGPEAMEDATLLETSWVGILGHSLEKIFAPMGWDWRASAALFFGFVAKEVVVSAMAILYGVEEEALSEAIVSSFTPLTAYAYMAFVLIYVPCLVTLAALKGEFGWKWMFVALVYELILAYLVALGIIQVGHLIGLR